MKIKLLTEIIEAGYQITPEALDLIASHEQPEKLTKHILSKIDKSVLVIDVEHLNLKECEHICNKDSDLLSDKLQIETKYIEFKKSPTRDMKLPLENNGHTNSVEVLFDISDKSTCIGEYMEFVQYFRDRYNKLSDIIRGRVNSRPIESLLKYKSGSLRNSQYEEISLIGMVSSIRTTSNGHKLVEIEDTTGTFLFLVSNKDKELFALSCKLILDEVIAVTGVLTNDGNLLIANKLMFPDLPNVSCSNNWTTGKAVFISDVHVGSSTFLEHQWEKFLSFLRGESNDPKLRQISNSIRYVLVAGDVVDGIGIYPGQENELSIKDVYEQYKKAGEYFSQIPEHIQIIISPGNHDAVRQAEPQPKLPEKIRQYFPENILFVGNPAYLSLEGVKVLMYHGRSIDDLVASIPGVSYQEPTKAMVEMMRRRHISPIYGSRVSIAPEKNDHFVIDHVPDIVHCGHVHTIGAEVYRNVLLINSGTWQDQTEFQKRVNLVPDPAKVPIVDLSSFKTSILNFN